ncbi:MAG: TonB-dependent receptor plug domain-containing protein [Flavobacteriaceae bacterium]|nr:TonB-dependent receptor plug domain-containing protein [Flavobacteriaceae bacterium]
MKTNFLRRSAIAALTLTTASFYFAQEEKQGSEKNIDEVVLVGVADIAKDRKTPVAVSTVKSAQIIERLGNQELTEVLNTTPSVYATKSGGGFGDGGITMRGFESRNIAVMVNGMPVNDMEGGAVYFSNWTGLSDVTSTIQVQRGLGSSKLAIASVGGTMNFITRAADMKKGGVVRIGVANNDYHKASFSYNTGKTENGWSTSFLMSRTAGSYYVQNTDFESYAYYFALGFEPNKKHNFQFTITSSPQWHDQRSFTSKIQDYIDYNPDHDGNPYRQYNPDFGYYTDAAGRRRALSNKSNFYAKPVMMFNWDWNITPKSKLSTVLYASNGRGGGTGDLGDLGGVRGQNVTAYRDADGHINYDAIFAANAAIDANTAGAKHTLVRRASMNSHNWYGILANFQHKINDNWKFSIGTDDRYYYGYHYQTLTHLYGANGYKDNSNKNIPAKVVSRVHDYKNLPWNPFGGKTLGQEEHIGYSNDGEVLWYSGFGQVEFTKNNFSAFIQGSVSNQAYRRIDNFVKEDGTTKQQGQFVDTKTSFKNLIGYNVKGGANYNINENHNVFANVGFYSKQPFMSAVYPNNQQVLNPNLTNEKIFSAEVGYGFRSSKFNANLNLYRTEWRDRSARIPNQTFVTASGNVRGYSEINGITQVHMGVEVDATYKPVKFLELQGMFSYGDYRYKGNATGADFDESNNPVTTTTGNTTLYLDQVKVGGSGNSSIPQLTASLGATIKPISDLSIYGTWRFVGNLYSAVNTNDYKTVARQEQGALRLPDYNLLDLGASYKLRLRERSQYFTFGVNVYNVIDTYYISDASTSIHATGASTTYKGIDTKNRVFFGAGRTWAASVAFNF